MNTASAVTSTSAAAAAATTTTTTTTSTTTSTANNLFQNTFDKIKASSSSFFTNPSNSNNNGSESTVNYSASSSSFPMQMSMPSAPIGNSVSSPSSSSTQLGGSSLLSSPPPQSSSSSSSMFNNKSNIYQSFREQTFIDPTDLKQMLHNFSNRFFIVLLDCRTFSDFNVKHIKESVNLDCRNRLIRKRLESRRLNVKDLKNKDDINKQQQCSMSINNNNNNSNENYTKTQAYSPLSNANQQQQQHYLQQQSSVTEQRKPVNLEKLNLDDKDADSITTTENENNYNKKDDVIIIYDDKTSDLNELQVDPHNPLRIVQENIKKQGYEKECKILKGGFQQFQQLWPEFCVNKEQKNKCNSSFYDSKEQMGQCQAAIDNAVMTRVTNYLYLGNECDARNEAQLDKEGIGYLLNVTKNVPFFFDNLSKSNIKMKRIAVNDDYSSRNFKDYFQEAIDFIDEAVLNNSKILVHCQAGISRSPTIVIAYLMFKLHLSYNDAYNRVRSLRPIISPNIVFLNQLKDYEIQLDNNLTRINSNNNNANDKNTDSGTLHCDATTTNNNKTKESHNKLNLRSSISSETESEYSDSSVGGGCLTSSLPFDYSSSSSSSTCSNNNSNSNTASISTGTSLYTLNPFLH